MKLAQAAKLGGYSLIALNLLMAFGSIWIFMRMAPAIEIIIDRNERSLQACEEMLSLLALANQPTMGAPELEVRFSSALNRARNNITEKEEPIAIDAIRKSYREAFRAEAASQNKTVSAILRLAEINRIAMVVADQKAKRLGGAGAWGIVFMASALFFVGMLFMRIFKRSLIDPLEEIQAVLEALKRGDSMRRCAIPEAPRDIRSIFDGINGILDQNASNALNNR